MRRQSTRSVSASVSLLVATCGLGILPGFGVASDPQGDDLLGAWRLTFTSPDGKARESILTLSRQGTALRGDYWDGKTTSPARDLGFERGELSFWVDGKYAGRTYTLTYRGRPRANALRGAVRWKYGWASGSVE